MNRTEPPPPQHKRLSGARHDNIRPEADSAGSRLAGRRDRTGLPGLRASAGNHPAQDPARTSPPKARGWTPRSPSRASSLPSSRAAAVLPEESQDEIAPLIDAYIRMLGPSRLIRGVRRRIEETLLSAEAPW